MAAPVTTIRRFAATTLALVALVGILVLIRFPFRPAAAVEAPALVPATAPAPAPPASTVFYGPAPHQVMDLWTPDATAFPGPRPVVLYVHAGGWISGDRRAGVPEALFAQLGRGYAVASVDYQLASTDADGTPVPSFPGAIWDVKRAVRFLKAQANGWELDPSRGAQIGAVYEAFLTPHQEGDEEENTPATTPKQFRSSTPSQSRAARSTTSRSPTPHRGPRAKSDSYSRRTPAALACGSRLTPWPADSCLLTPDS